MTKAASEHIRVRVEVDSAADRALTEWLRRWRRRGARPKDKVDYELQGVEKVMRFRAPSEAVADLAAHLLPLGGSIAREQEDLAAERAHAAAAPLRAPLDWDQETSLRHWFPDASTRAELAAHARAAAQAKSEAQRKKAWAQVVALFPAALAQLIGRSPWRWGTIPSPEVAAEAMRLITAAPTAGSAGEVKAIEGELTRILPDLPALCLPEVVGNDAYTRAWRMIDAAIRSEGNSDFAQALEGLRGYLSTT